MGRINVDISDELEKQLRLKTVEIFGGKKGDLSKAVQQALRTWISNNQWSRNLKTLITILWKAYVKGKGKPASLEHPRMRVMGNLAGKLPLQNSSMQSHDIICSPVQKEHFEIILLD